MTEPTHPPPAYTLWFETLPSGDTARLVVASRDEQYHVTLYWNREQHSERAFAARKDADAWGYELHAIVMQDALAGALLGYDPEVVSKLTDAVGP